MRIAPIRLFFHREIFARTVAPVFCASVLICRIKALDRSFAIKTVITVSTNTSAHATKNMIRA
jgi:hypothetical protein